MGIGFICRPAGVEQKPKIVVTAPAGSTVTCSNGTVTETAEESNGTWTFSWLDPGTWEIFASLGGQTAKRSVEATEAKAYYITLDYNQSVIIVTAPDGCYVQLNDFDGKIYQSGNVANGTYTFRNVDPGEYCINLWRGEEHAWKNITVGESQEYRVTMNFWDGTLYDAGNEYTDITGGWVAQAWKDQYGLEYPATGKAPSITRGSTKMTVKLSQSRSGKYESGAAATSQAIDLTNFSKLQFTGSSNETEEFLCWFGVLPEGETDMEKAAANMDIKTSNKTYTLDISKLSGRYYIFLGLYVYNLAASVTITATKIKLS